jgi:hypothetical protein
MEMELDFETLCYLNHFLQLLAWEDFVENH